MNLVDFIIAVGILIIGFGVGCSVEFESGNSNYEKRAIELGVGTYVDQKFVYTDKNIKYIITGDRDK